ASQSANASRRSPRHPGSRACASSGWGGITAPVRGWRTSPSGGATTTTAPGEPPSLSWTLANTLATPYYWSCVPFSIGWLWHRAQVRDRPRNAMLELSVRSIGSRWSTKKLAAPLRRVPPLAVTIVRANRSQGTFSATLLRTNRENAHMAGGGSLLEET